MTPLHSHQLARRDFIKSTLVLSAAGLWLPGLARGAAAPTSNPVKALRLAWTEKLRWDAVVDIATIAGVGEFWDERLNQAQEVITAKGGGVVFFPAGQYHFREDIHLRSGVILRGAEPAAGTSARDEKFALPSQLEFPMYAPTFTGSDTPVNPAFKGIVLADPATATNCGVVHLSLNRGCIVFAEAEGHRCGANRLVFGCVLRNAAGAMDEIPNAKEHQRRGFATRTSSVRPSASTLPKMHSWQTTAFRKAVTIISR